jgi:hypothetical protein
VRASFPPIRRPLGPLGRQEGATWLRTGGGDLPRSERASEKRRSPQRSAAQRALFRRKATAGAPEHEEGSRRTERQGPSFPGRAVRREVQPPESRRGQLNWLLGGTEPGWGGGGLSVIRVRGAQREGPRAEDIASLIRATCVPRGYSDVRGSRSLELGS